MLRKTAILMMITVHMGFALAACVSTETHRAVQDDLANTRNKLALLNGELDTARTGLGECRAALDKLAEHDRELTDEHARLTTECAHLEAAFMGCEDTLARTRLLLDQTSEEAELLRVRLEQLSAIEEETRLRNAIYAEFVSRFQHMIDAGQLEVLIERGRIVLQLPQDILFESGKAIVSKVGRETLLQIAEVIAQIDERQFQIEGHTDNVPINTTRFPSNWELSTARAQAVVYLFVEAGVSPQNISVSGYGEHHPRASNETKEGKALNRRIEIIMLPNLDLLSNDVPGM